ncbi:MAG: DUF523 domain-containing protein [bacterium]|nr:DUF523 domain-containing protein [bacterium]
MLISMCVLGIPCRYDGRVVQEVADLVNKYPEVNLIPVCSEQLGGLPTPRNPSEIMMGTGDDVLKHQVNVLDESGNDVTSNFLEGAECVLSLSKKYSAEIFIGCRNSPSCSCLNLYDGSFKKKLRKGMGVTSALLKKNGLQVMEIKEFKKLYNSTFQIF